MSLVPHTPTVNLIYARSLNHVIGNQGKLPWKIDGDLPRFRDLTTNHIVIMGYNTWMSLPRRPLPYRFNVVVTKNHFDEVIQDLEECQKAAFHRSLSSAMEFAKHLATERGLNIWIIGGAEIYRQAEPFVDNVYETVVLCNQVAGDAFYHHTGHRELISEDRTVADINGQPFDTVHRVFKILK